MGAYSILLKASVQKDLADIPRQDLQRIMARIGRLADDPRPPGSEKLSGQERYRVRQGPYRIVYSIEDRELTVWVVKVGHRREVYRWCLPTDGVHHRALADAEMTAHLWHALIADLKVQHSLRHVPFELLLQLSKQPKKTVPAFLARIAAGQG